MFSCNLRCAAALFVALAVNCTGCSRCDRERTPEAAASASAPLARSAAPATSAVDAGGPTLRRYRGPVGPRFAILAGKGIGPIRFGATVATIERHMRAPCEERSDTRCRYTDRGLVFELTEGVLSAIEIYRDGRTAGGRNADGSERTYGVFNGVIPPDLMLGMTPEAVKEVLGPPKQEDKAAPNPHGAEAVHRYPGMLLEYDRIPATGKLALGRIRLEK